MAKSKTPKASKAPSVKAVTATAAPLTKRVENGSPYQLDPAQVERAATALIANMKQHAQNKEAAAAKKNLMADEEDSPELADAALFLTVSTKQHIQDSTRLIPSKIVLPHPTQSAEVRICLMVADPQRLFKDLVAEDTFPEDVRAKVGRVISIGKLKKKYKTYEAQRQLLAEYDVFLADDRVISDLPKVLGKVFASNKSKRPIPVSLAPQTPKDKDGKRTRVVRTPAALAKEIESALNSTYVHMSSSATTSIRVGKLAQKPEQISANVQAVVDALTTKFIPKGWRNVRAIHIKGPTTAALPVWLADELWAEDAQVLEEAWKPTPKEGENKTAATKRKWEEWEDEMLDDDELAERNARLARGKKSKAAKAEKSETGDKADKVASSISKEKRTKMKKEALKSVATPLISA